MRYLAIPLCVLLSLLGLSAHAAKPGGGGDTTIETRVTDLEAAVADNAARLDAEEAATASRSGHWSA